MIRPFEEVKKDWNIEEWDELLSIKHILGDKYESIQDNLSLYLMILVK